MHNKTQKGKMIGFKKERDQQKKHENWSAHRGWVAQDDRHFHGLRHSHQNVHPDADTWLTHSGGYVGRMGRKNPHKHARPIQADGRLEALLQEKWHLRRRIHRLQRKLWALNHELKACSSPQEQSRRRHSHRDWRPDIRARAF